MSEQEATDEFLESPHGKPLFMYRFAKFISLNYGERCQDRASGCACCEMWALFDLVDTMIDVD